MSEPYYIWSETPGGGCPNFLTGAGIYLQSVWAGYAGVRYTDDSLHVTAPRLLPNTTSLTLRGISYAGARLLLEVSQGGAATLQRLDEQGAAALLVAVGDGPGVLLTAAAPAAIPPRARARVFVAAT